MTPSGNEMTPTADLAALNEWNLTPEMFQSLPDLMFAIAAGDGPTRERIAAARVLLAIDKQNISRAAKKGALPPIVEIVHMDLPEDVCEEFEQDEPSPSDLFAEETDIGISHPTDAGQLSTTPSCPTESIGPGRASLSSDGEESLPHSARSGDATREEETADKVGEAHPEDLPRAFTATQSRGHRTRRGELSNCVPITARGHPIQDPNGFGESSIRYRRGWPRPPPSPWWLSEGQFSDPLQLRRLGQDPARSASLIRKRAIQCEPCCAGSRPSLRNYCTTGELGLVLLDLAGAGTYQRRDA